jgi:hypothetical protein
MSLWRVRMTMPADPISQEWLAAALTGQRVLAQLPPRDDSDPIGEMIIDLPRDDSLGTLLSDLHAISPQILVSSVSELPQLPGGLGIDKVRDQHLGEPGLVAAGRPASLQDQAAV